MDKGAIKRFATNARNKLIASVSQRAFEIGITEDNIIEPVTYEDGFKINDHFLRQTDIDKRNHLINKINQSGFEHIIEEVAYMWFNRFIAIRFMEVNDYLPTGVRMFSSIIEGKTEPDALTEIDLLMDDLQLNQDYIYELQDEGNHDALFKYVVIQQCNQLGDMMPLIFEEITGYTELLLPDYLLAENSVIFDLVAQIDEDAWKEVEIIGWLYQYYNAEKKDEVFARLRKNIKIDKHHIPAATQLFTPRWIVEYMVDNSLGELWLESRPDAALKEKLTYYVADAEQPLHVQEQIQPLANDHINPEMITFLDPSMGSGHVLIYAFEVFYDLYLSQGYRKRDIPKLIIEKNLYGFEIDERATQLAYFALLMKAREYDSHIFIDPMKANLFTITESNDIQADDVDIFVGESAQIRSSFQQVIDTFTDAKLYGSIIQMPEIDVEPLKKGIMELKDKHYDSLFALDFNTYTLPIIERLIDQTEHLQKQYDIVVTNPPYMGRKGMDPQLVKYVREHYKDASADLFAVFMMVARRFVREHGFIGMINQHAWMFLSSYEKLRKHMLTHHQIYSMAHLGTRAFAEIGGEVVQTTTFVMRKKVIPDYQATFIRLTEIENAEEKAREFFNEKLHYVRTQDAFSDIPGSPIAYWASKQVMDVFKVNKKINDLFETKKGMFTGKNDRFLRLWYEIAFNNMKKDTISLIDAEMSEIKWFPCAKGGSYRKWYGNQEYVINWYKNGEELKEFERSGINNTDYFFKSSITWSDISSSSFSCRYLPNGFIFESVSPILLANNNMFYMLGIMNSKPFDYVTKFTMSTMHFSKGLIDVQPVIEANHKEISEIVHINISLSKSDWDSFETSWDFATHPLITFKKEATKISNAFANWEAEAEHRFQTLKANEEELNRIFIDLYGLQEELTPEVADKDVTVNRADPEREIRSLLSYFVGIMFGRYSLDREGLVFAGGTFDSQAYHTFQPDEDNIIPITDEMYFPDDIVGRTITLLKLIYGEEHLEANLEFIADSLTRKTNETARERIRRYYLKEFFKDHVRTYQKRPIYWLIDSGKQDGFKALIYVHRYETDLLSRVRTQYLHPQIQKYREEIGRLTMTVEADVSQVEKTRAKKSMEKIEKQIIECQQFDQVIAHMAHQQIALDLDDGVKVNYAKFQNIVIPQGEGKQAVTANVFAKF